MKLNKLLKQLKQYANHVREVEYECNEACGIEFAVEVIEKGKFPHWVTKKDYENE